jgi:hypothetical protein
MQLASFTHAAGCNLGRCLHPCPRGSKRSAPMPQGPKGTSSSSSPPPPQHQQTVHAPPRVAVLALTTSMGSTLARNLSVRPRLPFMAFGSVLNRDSTARKHSHSRHIICHSQHVQQCP